MMGSAEMFLEALSENNHTPKPEWWSDDALKALSACVLATNPTELWAVQMRAHVMWGHPQAPKWTCTLRTLEELQEAAEC